MKTLVVDGEVLTVSECSRKFGTPIQSIQRRLRLGWSDENAARMPTAIRGEDSPRKAAKLKGEKYYIGSPCKRCGNTERLTRSASCIMCLNGL